MVIKTGGTQKEQTIVPFNGGKTTPILHYDIEYDTTKPEETIRKFVADIRGMLARYEGNKDRIDQLDMELNDLEHFIESASYKPIGYGYKLYRRLAELRKERRACKNETDLLKPIYDFFRSNDILNRLGTVQGECGKNRNSIDNRCYVCRTNVVEEINDEASGFFARKKKPETEPEQEAKDDMPFDPDAVMKTVEEFVADMEAAND